MLSAALVIFRFNILFQLIHLSLPYPDRCLRVRVYDHHRPCLVCLCFLIMDSHQCPCLP